jgi:probable HAF family extracellular repeat protein
MRRLILMTAVIRVASQVTAATFQGLGDLPGGIFHSGALAVSNYGRVVVGKSVSTFGDEAFRWEAGVMTGLGDFPEGIFDSTATDVSEYGSVVVGSGYVEGGKEAFRWENGVLSGLGHLSDPVSMLRL